MQLELDIFQEVEDILSDWDVVQAGDYFVIVSSSQTSPVLQNFQNYPLQARAVDFPYVAARTPQGMVPINLQETTVQRVSDEYGAAFFGMQDEIVPRGMGDMLTDRELVSLLNYLEDELDIHEEPDGEMHIECSGTFKNTRKWMREHSLDVSVNLDYLQFLGASCDCSVWGVVPGVWNWEE